MLFIVLATIAIEALLAFRAWVQLSGWQLDVGALSLLYDISGLLVAPFRGIETTTPIRHTDILELSTVVAVEVYLVAAVILFGAALLLRALFRHVTVEFEPDGVVLTTRPERQTV